MKKRALLLGTVCLSLSAFAQQPDNQVEAIKPSFVVTASSFSISERLSDFPEEEEKTYEDKKEFRNNFERGEYDATNALPQGEDPVWQKTPGTGINRAPEQNWQALSGGNPPDPSGAAGPNHYVQMVNSQYRVYDKTGTILKTGSLGSILGGGNAGDPIVMYDKFADRWFMSQFDFNNNLWVAISETPDPMGSFYTYSFNVGSSFPDYPKYSIWSDGYYVTANKSGNHSYVMERDKMLAGDQSAQMIGFSLVQLKKNGFFSALPLHASSTLPSLGTPCSIIYFEDDSWSGVSTDALRIWDINVDWDTPSNSSITSPYTLPTAPFDSQFTASWDDITQPGTSQKLDGVPGALMYMAQYREFNDHNSVVINHTVDVNGANRAGIRWYELRQTNGGPWSIYQQGTYSPDSDSRWLGSICMDKYGNIALAYSVSSSTTFPSIRYTGRWAGETLGEMTYFEQTAIDGTSSKTGNGNRYGDYAQMTIDPDDETFWYTGEYVSGGTKTRVFSLKMPTSFVSIEDEYMSKTLVVGYSGNNIFDLSIRDMNETVNITVTNPLGQTVKRIESVRSGSSFNYLLDLNGNAAGYYVINVGNDNFSKSHKIWVK